MIKIHYDRGVVGIVVSFLLGIGFALTLVNLNSASAEQVPQTIPTAPQSFEKVVPKQHTLPEKSTKAANLSINGFDAEQTRILELAYKKGLSIGYPETMQAIAIQETHAGSMRRIGDLSLPVGKRSYGVMQIKVATVRYVFRHFPFVKNKYFNIKRVSDEEIISLMMTNDDANVSVAALYFKLLVENTKTWSEAVASYNQGLGGLMKIDDPRTFQYTKNISFAIRDKVRPFNEEAGLNQNG